MPTYPVFPTLSTTAKLSMLFPSDKLINPSTAVRYDGGMLAVRENNHRMIWSNVVVLQVDATDRALIYDFLRNTTHMKVYAFQFTHPDTVIGTIIVRYMADELPWERAIQALSVVSGTTDNSMYEIRLPLEEQYP